MNNINMYHKTILDYTKHLHKNDAIDNCRYNHNNMVGEDFTDTIKRDLPILHNAFAILQVWLFDDNIKWLK